MDFVRERATLGSFVGISADAEEGRLIWLQESGWEINPCCYNWSAFNCKQQQTKHQICRGLDT